MTARGATRPRSRPKPARPSGLRVPLQLLVVLLVGVSSAAAALWVESFVSSMAGGC